MRAVQLLGQGQVEVRNVPEPTPSSGEALLEVLAAGVCGSDVHLTDHDWASFTLPMTLGHETIARVVALGPDTSGPAIGTNVMVAGLWGCKTCRKCTLGLENTCELWTPLAPIIPGPGLGHPGGMADYMVAPVASLFDIGALDPVLAAPLADAATTSAHAINLARPHLTPDATAVVIGIGGLGHMALQILRATTACRIVAVDSDTTRLADAHRYGADDTMLASADTGAQLREATRGLGAEVIFDFVGVDHTLSTAAIAAAPYGAIVVVGLGGGTLRVSAQARRAGSRNLPWGTSLIRPYGATRREITEVIALAAAGKLTAAVETYPLNNASTVLQSLRDGNIRGRAVLLPAPSSPGQPTSAGVPDPATLREPTIRDEDTS